MTSCYSHHHYLYHFFNCDMQNAMVLLPWYGKPVVLKPILEGIRCHYVCGGIRWNDQSSTIPESCKQSSLRLVRPRKHMSWYCCFAIFRRGVALLKNVLPEQMIVQASWRVPISDSSLCVQDFCCFHSARTASILSSFSLGNLSSWRWVSIIIPTKVMHVLGLCCFSGNRGTPT